MSLQKRYEAPEWMGYWGKPLFPLLFGGNIAASEGRCWWRKELLVLILTGMIWALPCQVFSGPRWAGGGRTVTAQPVLWPCGSSGAPRGGVTVTLLCPKDTFRDAQDSFTHGGKSFEPQAKCPLTVFSSFLVGETCEGQEFKVEDDYLRKPIRTPFK